MAARGDRHEPSHVREGISTVIVNGRFVVDGGKPTDAKPGRVLERQRSVSGPPPR